MVEVKGIGPERDGRKNIIEPPGCHGGGERSFRCQSKKGALNDEKGRKYGNISKLKID